MLKHLLNINDLSSNDVNSIFEKAEQFKQQKKYPKPEKVQDIGLCFWENSTRTRVSFELAAKNLGHRPLYVYAKQSSTEKGESLLDTLLTLYATGIKSFVIRHPEDKYYQNLVADLPEDMTLINAGDGKEGHPTQALLDVWTLSQHSSCLEDIKVLFVGDVTHSRVVRSNVKLLKKYHAQTWAYVPEHFKSDKVIEGLEYKNDLDQAMQACDVVMMLRAQDERWQHNELNPEKSRGHQDYLQQHGLNQKRLKILKKDALILHPGPFRRNVEIDQYVLQDPRCLIWKQVENGVYIRMAILNGLLKRSVQ